MFPSCSAELSDGNTILSYNHFCFTLFTYHSGYFSQHTQATMLPYSY